MNVKIKQSWTQTGRYLIIIVALIFFLFPIVWIILTAFKTGEEFMLSPPIWLPHSPTLSSFVHIVKSGGLRALFNSIIIATSVTVLSLVVGSLAGYALARFKVGGENLPFFILSQRFMPPVAIIFPFLLFFKALGWMDTHQALIIVYLTFNLPYSVWMMRGFFIEIPIEIEESAFVDGCSPFRAFWSIILPLVTPGLVATGVFCFIFSWHEFFFAVCLTRSRAVPLSVYLPNFFGKEMIMWGEIGAVSLMAMVPLFFMSFVVQRYLVRGLTLGAVK